MRNAFAIVLACLLAAALGAGAVWHFTHREEKLPDPPALVLKVREVARLETLDVSLYKKIDFSPDPQPTGSTWADVVQWASYSLRPPRGRAIICAGAHPPCGRIARVMSEAAVQKVVLVMQWSPRQVPSSRWICARRMRISLFHSANSGPPTAALASAVIMYETCSSPPYVPNPRISRS